MAISLISAVLLFLSGLMITGAGAYFSVKGFLLWIPDEEIHTGLFILAVAFEIAKITASTFLFHEGGKSPNRYLFWAVLGPAIAILVLLSAVFTFSHLNVSVSKTMGAVQAVQEERERMEVEANRFRESIERIDAQITSLPEKTSVSQRIRMVKTFESEKKEANNRLVEIENRIRGLDERVSKEDRFVFLNSISKLLGVDRDKMFTLTVIGIVALIDPLAITLFLAGTVILTRLRRTVHVTVDEEAPPKPQAPTMEAEEPTDTLPPPEVALTPEQVVQEVMEELQDIERDEQPSGVRKKLLRVTDFLRERIKQG